MTALIAALAIGAGLTFVVVGALVRPREREAALADFLDLPWAERDVPKEAIEAQAAFVASTIGLASKMLDQFDAKGSLRKAIERARLPIRPGEFVIVAASAAFTLGTLLWLVGHQWLFLPAAMALCPVVAWVFLDTRVRRLRKRFEAQLPDALTVIAGSLSAGHTFLRAIQLLCEEADSPMKEELSRVVHETQLGDPLVDSLERLSRRIGVRDLAWIVQAIRVQQEVGGKLADLLHTLADFIRAREEVRREVDVLTAEGRVSAYVLGALPFGLLGFISVGNHSYMAPMFRGWGYVWLGGMAASVGVGMLVILRMVKKIEV